MTIENIRVSRCLVSFRCELIVDRRRLGPYSL